MSKKRNVNSAYSTCNGFGVTPFTDDELYAIHQATLEVFRTTGVKFYSDEALKTLQDGNCEVDFDTKIAKIPEYVVEECIASAPSQVLLAGRDKKHDTLLEGNRVAWTNFGAGVEIYDPYTNELRKPTVEDVGNTAKVVDALDNVNVYSQAVVGRDAPKATEDLDAANAFLNNTTKHCHHIDLSSGAAAERFIRMGAAISGGMDEQRRRPTISALICPTSPLQMSEHGCDIIQAFARAQVPINVLSMALAGGTTPITMAGTLVSHNAEVLGGLVLTQLTEKGAPFIYGSSTTIFDMKNMTAPVGAPELGMINAAVGALAQYYNLPSYTAGG